MTHKAVRRRLRILYTQRPTGGGSTRSLYELLRGLDRERFEPIVLFLDGMDHHSDFGSLDIKIISLAKYHGEQKSPSVKLAITNKKINGRYSIRDNAKLLFMVDIPTAWAVTRIIKKHGIDLVHQNIGLNRGVMLGARMARVPQVHHFRLFGDYPISAKLLMSADQRLIFISGAVSAHYISRGVPEKQSMVIYNPIDNSRFEQAIDSKVIREEFCVADDEWLIASVGRITPWKGQMYFLEAMVKVASRFPNIKILIVGSPSTGKDKDYLVKLKDYVAGSPIRDKVIFTGLRSDIPEIMTASDVIVHSASEPEPFGRVIVEAMLAGTPIVATRSGGVPEILKDGETGLLVPVKDSQAIADSVEKLLASDDLRLLISRNARPDAAARFSVSMHVEKVQMIYDTLCQR